MSKKNPEIYEKLKHYISEYQHENEMAPSSRQIAMDTGLSKSTVSRYLLEMKNSGEIYYEGDNGYSFINRHNLPGYSPIVGNVACGPLMLAEENICDYVKLPESIFGTGNLFILQAKGNSMIKIGINNGDLVVVRQQNTADPGQVVVALVDEEATLKRYYPEPELHRIRLHPENDGMDDIFVKNCKIQGIVVKVIKDVV